MKIGSRLKELRNSSNLTQTEMGNIVGKTRRMIGFYEKDINFPDYDTLAKYSTHFGVTTDWILGLDDENKYKKIKAPVETEAKEIVIPKNAELTPELISFIKKLHDEYNAGD